MDNRINYHTVKIIVVYRARWNAAKSHLPVREIERATGENIAIPCYYMKGSKALFSRPRILLEQNLEQKVNNWVGMSTGLFFIVDKRSVEDERIQD